MHHDARNKWDARFEKDIRVIIRRVTKGRRHIIAARMTKILGRQDDPITPATFAEFCRKAPGKRHTRFPAAWVRPFCEAADNDGLAVYLQRESARLALSASAGIVESGEAVTRAQEALGRVQTELRKLTEGNQRSKR